MTISVDGSVLNSISTMHARYLQTPDAEFEFRLGNMDSKGFVPGVTQSRFDAMFSRLQSIKKYVREQSSVYVYTEGYREIRTISPTRTVLFQQKISIQKPVVVDGIGRFTLSSEKVVNSIPRDVRRVDRRDRDRYSFRFPEYTIDMTIVNKSTFEVEIEYPSISQNMSKLFEPIKLLWETAATPVGNDIVSNFNSLMSIDKKRELAFNNAINMKRKYFESLADYVITPKWDGTRMFLYVFGGQGYLFNKTTRIHAPVDVSQVPDSTVLDGEFFESGRYIAYDILFISGRDIRQTPRTYRTLLLEQTYSEYAPAIELAEVGYGANMYTLFKNYVSDPGRTLDGVVFAPRDSYYYNKHTLKYKPIELLTIDFLITVDTQGRYPKYNLFVQDRTGPVPFRHYPYIQKVSEYGKALIGSGGRIVECKWVGDTFVPHRVREDKTTPNFTTIADDIWEDINYPITESEMGDVLKAVSHKFTVLRPFEGEYVNLDTEYVCVASSAGKENSLQQAVLYSCTPGFQLKRQSEREREIASLPRSLLSIAHKVQKNISIYDMYGGKLVMTTTTTYTETILLSYVIGGTYYSVGVVDMSDSVCRTVLRILKAVPSSDVAKHYDLLVRKQNRAESSILAVRNFNNWIKAVLISSYVKADDAVLDLGSGRGGDLGKWCQRRIRLLTSVDVSAKSLEDAKVRLASMPWCKFAAEWIHANAYTTPLVLNTVYDVVSCQFSLHYAFDTEQHARTTVSNIASNLKTGGVFIATIPDAAELRMRARETLEFGNEYYTVKFADTELDRPFGVKYTFTLSDSVVQCPEYLVDTDVFTRIANESGLSVEKISRFPEFAQKNKQKFSGIATKMHVRDLTPEENAVASIYNVVVLRKL